MCCESQHYAKSQTRNRPSFYITLTAKMFGAKIVGENIFGEQMFGGFFFIKSPKIWVNNFGEKGF